MLVLVLIDNCRYCSKCKEHTLAKKQIEIWRLPHILIFHLKRFKYSGNMWRDKISCFVDFPERLLEMFWCSL